MPLIMKPVYVNGAVVPVTVDVVGNFGLSEIDEQLIAETAMGLTGLHRTSQARNAPRGAIGYIHNRPENTLLAVGEITEISQAPWRFRMTILKTGQAKAGVHVFR